MVWSKCKFDELLNNEKIYEKILRKFAPVIPLKKLDVLLLVTEIQKPKAEEKDGKPPDEKKPEGENLNPSKDGSKDGPKEEKDKPKDKGN